MARAARDLGRRRADRPGPAPDRPRPLPRRRRRSRVRRAADRLLADGRRRQRVPRAPQPRRARSRGCTRRGRSGRTCSRSRSRCATRSSRSRVSAGATEPSASPCYEMAPEMGPPPATSWEWPQPDASWARELADVVARHRGRAVGRRRSRRLHRRVPNRRGGVRPMIITRTPLRISLGGGGTDVPSYYRKAGSGFLIAAAISKYVYIAVNQNFDDDILLKYSLRRAGRPSRRRRASAAPRVPARCAADVGRDRDLVDGRHSRREPASARRARSRSACSRRCTRSSTRSSRTSRSRPGRARSRSSGSQQSIGKQDQYIAAIGGLTAFEFHADERVEVIPIALAEAGPAPHRGQPPALLHRCAPAGIGDPRARAVGRERVEGASSTRTSTRCGRSATRRWTRSRAAISRRSASC